MKRPAFLQVATLAIFVAGLAYLVWLGYGAVPLLFPPATPTPATAFSGAQALAMAQRQCDFGARPVGSPAGKQTGDWIIAQLKDLGWEVQTHEFDWNGVPVRNIIAKVGTGPIVMVGAHYDTRPVADNDPDPAARTQPIVGANDGASGVAVLLELARVLDRASLSNEVWLTFFDAEDMGRLPGWDWAVGSRQFAESLTTLPEQMILLDMIGDTNQRFPFEGNSNPQLRSQIWQLAAEMGYGDVFVPVQGQGIIDDHIAFIERGVPAVDIIDFDYPYWHTTSDTCDKLSPDSLERVGRVVKAWLEGSRPTLPASTTAQ
jgi:glutaminyl-peptide cyclotransferase